MREIKFRQPIFNKDGKFLKFHYWGFVRDGEFTGVVPPIDEAKKNSQQFAGLHDKNGKEIYDGDIVQCESEIIGHTGKAVFDYSGKWVIEYRRGSHPFYQPDGNENQIMKTDLYSWISLAYSRNVALVIGNIYENPELLKDGQQKNKGDRE